MTTRVTILDRLDRVKQAGDGSWVACCPAHQDKTPSLSIKLMPDGKWLIHCFSGCDWRDVLAAVGLRPSDLFPPSDPASRARYRERAISAHGAGALQFANLVAAAAKADLDSGKVLSDRDIDTLGSAIRTIEGAADE